MSNDIQMYEGTQAIVETKRMNYIISAPNRNPVELKRDVDFAKIPKTKSISLLKPGAEKIVAAYGLLQHYTIESKIENVTDGDPFFYYLVRCDLCKVGANGQEYVFTSGYGSANSKERRCGFNGAFDSANSSCKMACKRALVAAAINIAGLSGAFTQDIEDENFITKNYEEMKQTADDNAPLTAKQIKRLYAIGAESGRNAEQVKTFLASKGFTSTKDIKQAQYDDVCTLLSKTE